MPQALCFPWRNSRRPGFFVLFCFFASPLEILVHQTGIEPWPSAVKDRVLTTGLPGNFQSRVLLGFSLLLHSRALPSSASIAPPYKETLPKTPGGGCALLSQVLLPDGCTQASDGAGLQALPNVLSPVPRSAWKSLDTCAFSPPVPCVAEGASELVRVPQPSTQGPGPFSPTVWSSAPCQALLGTLLI